MRSRINFLKPLAIAAFLLFQVAVVASAQVATETPTATEEADAEPSYLSYVAPKPIEMRIGVRVQAGDGNMLQNLATTVFPTDWPEQQVEIVSVSIPQPIRYDFRDLPGNNRQLIFQSQIIPAGAVVEATVHVRIQKSHIVGPEDPTSLIVPRRLPSDVRKHLGTSPYIESNATEIRQIVRQIEAEDPITEWQKVEMLYDWVRENIRYERGELKSVRETLRDRTGDCEEMTSTFVALCRAARVPARVVWIPEHCYPEFYMEDKEGNGYWFPCQAAGTRNFGSMPEYLPILQKGDRFKVPERKELQRYLADFLTSRKVTGQTKPQVQFIRDLLGDAANLQAPDLEGQAQENAADQTP